MGLIADSSLDGTLKGRLVIIRDCVAESLAAGAGLSAPPDGLLEAVEEGILALARAGQSDPGALERYGASCERAFLLSMLHS